MKSSIHHKAKSTGGLSSCPCNETVPYLGVMVENDTRSVDNVTRSLEIADLQFTPLFCLLSLQKTMLRDSGSSAKTSSRER